MLKLLVFELMVVIASASSQANWVVYKHKHNKTYSEEEDVIRRFIWQTNLKKIEDHNELFAQGKTSFYLGENHLTDLTRDEFRRKMNGLRISKNLKQETFQSGAYKGILEDSIDWRTQGYVTPVKNQQDCGSCWAFSTTGSLEGQHFKTTGQLTSLSESNLVDCSQKWGNFGCNGGLMDNAFNYIMHNKGIDTDKSYPYKPEDGKCRFKRDKVGATVKSFKDIKQGSEDELQKAVSEVGPISIAIDASQDSFRLYSGGIYDEPECSSTELDHGVLVVGYGSESGADYWIVKNSWGVGWGSQGYILMSRNKNNQCGIASSASYPVV